MKISCKHQKYLIERRDYLSFLIKRKEIIKNNLEKIYNKYYDEKQYIEYQIIEKVIEKVRVIDGKVKEQYSIRNEMGLQCRVYYNGGVGISHTTYMNEEDYELTYLEAKKISQLMSKISDINAIHPKKMDDLEDLSRNWKDCLIKEKETILKEASIIASNLGYAYSCDLSYTKTTEINVYGNSNGVYKIFNICNDTLFQRIYASKGMERKYYLNRVCTKPNELFYNQTYLNQFIQIGKLCVEKLFQSVNTLPLLEVACDYIVVDNGLLGMIVHEAFGHSLEGDSIIKGLSNVICKYYGKKIASNQINIVANSQMKNCGERIVDAEGNHAMDTFLVKDGILVDFMHNGQSSFILEQETNGHSINESYYVNPLVRMSSIYMLPKNIEPNVEVHTWNIDSVKKLLIEKGIIAEKNKVYYLFDWSGGTTDWRKLTFNISVPFCYILSKNEQDILINNVSFIGNSIELFMDYYTSYGKIKVDSIGFCLKMQQMVKTSDGGPMLTVFKNSSNFIIDK